jgi:DNA-binding response OmpR family regulator
MPGRALLVTRDTYLAGLVQKVARELALQVQSHDTIGAAADALSRSSFDAVLVDCDDLAGGGQFLRQVRSSWTAKNAAIVAILNGNTSPADAMDLGADTTLEKSRADALLWETVVSVCRSLDHREHTHVSRSRHLSRSAAATLWTGWRRHSI